MSAVLWKVCGITRAADAEEAVRLGAKVRRPAPHALGSEKGSGR